MRFIKLAPGVKPKLVLVVLWLFKYLHHLTLCCIFPLAHNPMSRDDTPANITGHSKLRYILAMIPTIEVQVQTFANWHEQESPKLPRKLIDILDRINDLGDALQDALKSLESIYNDFSLHGRHSDDVVAKLQNKHDMDLSEEFKGANNVYVALIKIGSGLSKPGKHPTFVWDLLRSFSQKQAVVSFEKLRRRLGDHLGLIKMMIRHLRHAFHIGTKDQSLVILKEYDALDRMHLKDVLGKLRLRFDQDPFAVTVPLDPKREHSKEKGHDHADRIYDYLCQECQKEGVGILLREFEDMGLKWAAAICGDSPTPEMQTLEMAYITLSCGVTTALQQSVPRDEGMIRFRDETDYLRCRLETWQDLTSSQKLIIAVGGHFSHGKSSLLNALMGEDVLPTNSESNQHRKLKLISNILETTTTAIPCRIQHKADAKLKLEIPQVQPYQVLFERVKAYVPPQNNDAVPPQNNDTRKKSIAEEVAEFLERCNEQTFLKNPRGDPASGHQATKLVFTEREAVTKQVT